MSKRERDSSDIFDTASSKRVKRLVDQEQQQQGGLTKRAIMIGGSQGNSGGAMTNNITPCAACKLLRRRCAQECPFSPYFSPHEPQKFASVHKIFGASNVSKMLLEVPDSQRADTANSLVYEANARIRDPVYGCLGTISALQQQAQSLQAELTMIRAEIMRYRRYRESPIAHAGASALHVDESTTTNPGSSVAMQAAIAAGFPGMTERTQQLSAIALSTTSPPSQPNSELARNSTLDPKDRNYW